MTQKDTIPSVDQVAEDDEQARMSLLSHDIRSAVSDVIGGLRLVDLESLDIETRLQLERVRTAGELLARLTEEALSDVADSDHSISSNLYLFRLLQDTRLRWGGRAIEKGLTFETTVQAHVPPTVAIDKLMLERILSNLLGNAVKYTDVGTVTMRVDLIDDEYLNFTVCDEGPGFSEEALTKLFQYQGRPENTSKPGYGLGLHIAKDLADQLKGELTVKNRPEGGGEVTLSLPRSAWHFSAYISEHDSLPDLKNIKVLIAEDNATNQLILAQMLDIMAAEYEIASDGVEALNWLERETFDLALIDIDMPRLSGIDVMHTVRAGHRSHRNIPILAITAFVLRANREAIYQAGANRILAKPIVNIEALGRSISLLLGHEIDIFGDFTSTADTMPPPLMDADRLDNLLGIVGAQGAEELISRLINDLSNVQLNLGRAVHDNKPPKIRSETHILISLAGAVGANNLQRLAHALNNAAHEASQEDNHETILRLGGETNLEIGILLEAIRSGYLQHGNERQDD